MGNKPPAPPPPLPEEEWSLGVLFGPDSKSFEEIFTNMFTFDPMQSPQALQRTTTGLFLFCLLLSCVFAFIIPDFVTGGPKRKRKVPQKLPGTKEQLDAFHESLSPGGKLMMYGEAGYEAARIGALWLKQPTYPEALKPRKNKAIPRAWSTSTFGTETWNLSAMGVPSAIATVGCTEDVVKCVDAAAHFHFKLCVAGGRHSHLCMLDDALVIDLSKMRDVSVDPKTRIVTVQGGALNGDVNAAMAPHGIGFTLGAHPGTGVGGLVLQGGHGPLERMHGLSIDSLMSCKVVMADGTVKEASERGRNSDLFWALRGGCGNFGIVVEFTFQAYPVGEMGMVMQSTRVHLPLMPMVKLLGWPDRTECIKAWTTFAQSKKMGEQLSVNSAMVLPIGGPVIHSTECYVPTLAEGKKILEGIDPVVTSFGKPVDATMGAVSYHDDVTFAAMGPEGKGQAASYAYVTSSIHAIMDDSTIAALAKASASRPSCMTASSSLIITMVGGKAEEKKRDATAYYSRDAKFFVVIYAAIKPTNIQALYTKRFDEARKWCTDLKLALQPTSIGVYGQLSDDKASSKSSSPLAEASTDDDAYAHDYQHRVWGDNYAKLQKAKKKFDPKNLFSSTENVKPAA